MDPAPSRFYKDLPDTPGVYLMKGGKGEVLYVGKAGNLRRRVSSYFTRPHEFRIEKLLQEVARIDFECTDTAIEALIREAELIKKLRPPFNVREKDDKSFLHVEITREEFPRVILVRGTDPVGGERFGPFTSATSIREALRIIRRIFPFQTHPPERVGKFQRPCFDYELGQCPGTCVGRISRREYMRTVRNVRLFLRGKKAQIVRLLTREMTGAAKKTEFEDAEKMRQQLFALRHIQDVALIQESGPAPVAAEYQPRIEGYDISNISGDSAVGSMVVFRGKKPDKAQYRKFKIRTVSGANDVAMLREVLRRRLRNDWPLPDLMLIDGGLVQVQAARRVLEETGVRIPVVGVAKGPARKRNDFFGRIPPAFDPQVLIRVRDEAHRFAIAYHKIVRGKRFFE